MLERAWQRSGRTFFDAPDYSASKQAEFWGSIRLTPQLYRVPLKEDCLQLKASNHTLRICINSGR